MATKAVEIECPHCGSRLKAFRMPDGSGWDAQVQWACFNDDCPYYRDGWEWMDQQYAARASYRYRVTDPLAAKGSPLVVNSPSMLLDLIIEDPESAC